MNYKRNKSTLYFLLGVLILFSCSGQSPKTDSIIEDTIPVSDNSNEKYRQALQEYFEDITTANETAKKEFEKAKEKRIKEEKIRNSNKVYKVFISAIQSSVNNASTDYGEVELYYSTVHLVDFVPQGKVYILDYVESQKSNSSSLYSKYIGIGQPGRYVNKNWTWGKQKDYIVVRGGNYFSMVLNPCSNGEVNYTIGFIVKDESEVW